jgi:hypothetical protein
MHTIKHYFLPVLFFLITGGLFSQPAISFDKAAKRYGIRDKKTNAWLSQPVYNKIEKVVFVYGKPGCFLATKGNKKVFINAKGTATLSPFFDSVEEAIYNSSMFLVKHEGSYSFFKPGTGFMELPGKFEAVEALNDIYKITSGGKVRLYSSYKESISGFFDDISREFIYSSYDYNSRQDIPKNTHAYIARKNGKWGVCDQVGNARLEFLYDSVNPSLVLDSYHEVRQNGKWGLIDTSYQKVLDCNYEKLNFSYFRKRDTIEYIAARQNSKWGLIDLNGTKIISPVYDSIAYLQKEYAGVIKNKKMGLVSYKDKVIYPFKYDWVEKEAGNNRIDKHRLFLVNEGCEKCGSFIEPGGRWGMTDSSGTIVLPLNANCIPVYVNYKYASPANEEFFYNSEDSTKIGYIWNIGGTLKREFIGGDTIYREELYDQYTETTPYEYVQYFVQYFSGGKTGIAGRNGKMIIPAVYDDLKLDFSNLEKEISNTAPISDPYKIPLPNDDTYTIDRSHPLIAKRDGKWGLVNWTGKELSHFIYDSIFRKHSDSWLELNDSLCNLLGYQKWIYKVYKNGAFGYLRPDGKTLTEPAIQHELIGARFSILDSLIANPSYYPKEEEIISSYIVARDAKVQSYDLYSTIHDIDIYGNEFPMISKQEFQFITSAKFGILNTTNAQLLNDEWYDDMILPAKYRSFLLTSMKTQLLLGGLGEKDSVVDRITLKKIANHPGSPEDVFPLPNYLFVKADGKWYLKNILCPGYINVGKGFDSVKVYKHDFYKAFNNGKAKYYRFNYKGPFEASEIDMEYPDDPDVFRLACKKCEFELKKVMKEGKEYTYDEWGNETASNVTYTVNVPFVKSGLFNILDNNGQFLLRDWVNEILFPTHPDSTFSLTDSTSSTFRFVNTDTSKWPTFNTVAVKKDGKWKLLNTKDQSVFVLCDEVKFDRDKWMVKANGLTIFYSADDLKQLN